jgi:hypothetical protein
MESTHVKNNIFFNVYSKCISGKEKFYLSDGTIIEGHDFS